MKKLIFALSIFTLAFTSCSSDDDANSKDKFIGNWKVHKFFENDVEDLGDTCDYETVILVKDDGTLITKDFEADMTGTCQLYETLTGTWENIGDGYYSITLDDQSFIEQISFKGNKMTIAEDYEGDIYKTVYIKF